ncbi:MAG: hypothetical protein JXB00_13930 [Bacteroidales bacterium]|nr:hypothetical protein [Bacteroidales bacterium]
MGNKYRYIRFFIGLTDQVRELIKASREKYRQRLPLFLFFLLLSALFWFIRSLGEQYQDEIVYPVKYTRFPPNKMLVSELPDKLTLKVQASGIDIFSHKLPVNIKALKFNIESFALQESGNNSFYVLTSQLKDYITEDLENIRIIDITPDTLFFRFTDLVTRKVAVAASIQDNPGMLAKQFTLNGDIICVPDSIIATGPATILDTLHNVFTEPVTARNLNDTLSKTYNLQKINQLEFNRKKVRVVIPVDKFTERSLACEIKTINVPDTLTLKIFPKNVTVTYRISLSNYDRINPGMVIPVVDFNSAGNLKGPMLKVHLVDTPDYLYRLIIDPGIVEYLIEKR